MENWPDYIGKPELPDGYEWRCLKEALGIDKEGGGHPWYIRVSFTYKHSRYGTCSRHLNVPGYFDSPIEAVNSAMVIVDAHRRKRSK